MPINKIRSINDFIILYLVLQSHDGKEYDFTSHMVEFTYHESLFSPVVHGSMLVLDAVDYPTLLPIMGEERLKCAFTRQDEKSQTGGFLDAINFDLAVYTMHGQTNQRTGTGKSQTYFLKYISDEAYTNAGTKIHRKYRNMRYSDMAEKIFDDFLKNDTNKINIEETSGTYSYYAQNVKPFTAISNLALRSISNEDNGYNYLFYRDRFGYNFKTFSSLAKEEPVLAITYSPKNIPDEAKENDLYSVSQYIDKSQYDSLLSAVSGEATSALLTVDPLRRKFYLNAFDLRGDEGFNQHKINLLQDSDWSKFPHMHKSKHYIDNSRMFVNPRSNLAMQITDLGHKDTQYITERDSDIYIHEPEYYYKQTQSHIKQMQTKTMSVSLSGHPYVRAGSVIEFLLPEQLGKIGEKDAQELDKYAQGRYVVTKVTHILKNNKYTMNIDMVKDSFFSDIEARNPVEEYKNIF